MSTKLTKRRLMTGYLLIEVSMAMAIGAIATFYQLKEKQGEIIGEMGERQGEQLRRVGKAVNAYTVAKYSEVLNNSAVPGVANTRAPSVAELAALGFLESSFIDRTLSGGVYQTSLSLTPTGCVVPNCQITGHVVTSTPFAFAGTVYSNAVGAAVTTAGVDAGASTTNGATIDGYNGGWTMTNPVAGQPTGILAMRVGADSIEFSQFLRRDGALPMTGALNMGNQRITSVMVATPGTTLCGTKGDWAQDALTGAPVYCDGSKYQAVASANWKTTKAELPVCNAGEKGKIYTVMTPTTGTGIRAYACNGTGTWDPLAVNDDGTLTVAGNLQANTLTASLVVNAAGDSCAGYPTGAQAKDASGSPLYCQSGAWASAISATSTIAAYGPLQSAGTGLGGTATLVIGTHRFCALTGQHTYSNSFANTRQLSCAVNQSGGVWQLVAYDDSDYAWIQCRAICID